MSEDERTITHTHTHKKQVDVLEDGEKRKECVFCDDVCDVVCIVCTTNQY